MLLSGALLLALAAAPVPPLSERGKLLLSDDFSKADPAWAGKPGRWELVDGAVRATEVAEDKHAAVRRRPLAYHDAIFEFSFRFDGARMLALSINNQGGHVCRLTITPAGMLLQADKPNAKSELTAVRLGVAQTPVSPGEWHKVVLEVKGPRLTAILDGRTAVTGEHARVDVDKTDVGFPVSGQSAWIDDLKVYAVAGGK